jgi:shikimate dehydrogenase
MHNAAFRALGLDAVYLAFDVAPDRLAAAIEGARALGIRQLAVSLPHKESILPMLDDVDAVAREIGAVNTVTLRDDAFVGSNTDWIGAVRALERETEIGGADAVVLGAGGAARAALYGLVERGAKVRVLNRSEEKAAALARELGGVGSGPLEALADQPCQILINTTRVGLGSDESPVAAEAIRQDCVVLDAVYEPAETRLLRDAARRGARAVGGKWMLVHQAAEQLRLWSGKDAPIEVMAEAFDDAESNRVTSHVRV